MNDKIDNSIKQEVDKMIRGEKDPTDVKLEVIIVNKKIPTAQKSLSELKSLVDKDQSEVITKLHQIGVKEKIKSMPLSNSIYVQITIDQVKKISELSQVKKILLDKKQHVAL